MNDEFPREISVENWRQAIEETRRKEAAIIAKYREPSDPPIVSTVEQQILDEILEGKDKPCSTRPESGRSQIPD